MLTHYDNLKVARDAPAEVIKAAYRALSQRHHPDRNPGDADAVRTMQAINDSYAVLSDPARRREHDAWIDHHTRRPCPAPAAGPGHASIARNRQTRAARAYADVAPAARAVGSDRGPARIAGAVVVVALAVAGGTVWLRSQRTGVPPDAPTPMADPEWRIQALDPTDPVQARAQAVVAAARSRANGASTTNRPTLDDIAFPEIAMPVVVPSIDAVAAVPDAGASLPFAFDPNGRPWPAVPGYVAGFAQDFGDGLTTVTVDNRGNPSPVFVKLVALDYSPAPAVRHVYLPAHQQFRMEQLRPGRYEVRYHELLTGRLSRSDPFRLQQIDDGDRTHYSEVDITLYRVPGGGLRTHAIAPDAF